jgi:hypothetical protein
MDNGPWLERDGNAIESKIVALRRYRKQEQTVRRTKQGPGTGVETQLAVCLGG